MIYILLAVLIFAFAGLKALLLVICWVMTATFAMGLIKTIREGRETFDEFNQAGFTFGAFLFGRVPAPDGNTTLSSRKVRRLRS